MAEYKISSLFLFKNFIILLWKPGGYSDIIKQGLL